MIRAIIYQTWKPSRMKADSRLNTLTTVRQVFSFMVQFLHPILTKSLAYIASYLVAGNDALLSSWYNYEFLQSSQFCLQKQTKEQYQIHILGFIENLQRIASNASDSQTSTISQYVGMSNDQQIYNLMSDFYNRHKSLFQITYKPLVSSRSNLLEHVYFDKNIEATQKQTTPKSSKYHQTPIEEIMTLLKTESTPKLLNTYESTRMNKPTNSNKYQQFNTFLYDTQRFYKQNEVKSVFSQLMKNSSNQVSNQRTPLSNISYNTIKLQQQYNLSLKLGQCQKQLNKLTSDIQQLKLLSYQSCFLDRSKRVYSYKQVSKRQNKTPSPYQQVLNRRKLASKKINVIFVQCRKDETDLDIF